MLLSWFGINGYDKIAIYSSSFFICKVFAAEIEFQSGDIIFQTSQSSQSHAIMWASKSPYSHVGIIEVDGKRKSNNLIQREEFRTKTHFAIAFVDIAGSFHYILIIPQTSFKRLLGSSYVPDAEKMKRNDNYCTKNPIYQKKRNG